MPPLEAAWHLRPSSQDGGQVDARPGAHIAHQIGAAPTALKNPVGLSTLLAQEGRPVHGLQVLTFCLRQPAMARDIRIQAEALFAELSAGLPPEAVKETEEMGQALDLDAAIAGVLTGMDPLPPSGDQSLDSTCPPVSAPATNAPLVGIRFERGGTVV